MGSFLRDFIFPEKQELTVRLKDVLDDEVDEKYYLSDEQTKRLKMNKNIDVAKTVRTGGRGSVDRHSWDIVAEPKVVAGIGDKKSNGGTQWYQQDRVYDDGVAISVTSAFNPYYRTGGEPKCVRVGGLYDSDKSKHQAGSVYDPQGIAATLSTMQGGNQEPIIVASRGRGENNEQHLEPNRNGTTNTITSVAKDNYVVERGGTIMDKVAIRTANKKGYDMAEDGDGIDLSYPESTTRRGRVGHGVSKTLMATDSMGTMQNYRIRKLTPLECWRLMGFDDEDFKKAQASGVSNSQLYKQAGNSIVVNVLEGILKNLLEGEDGRN